MIEPYLTTEQLALRWGVKPSTIKTHRARNTGPPYYAMPRFLCTPVMPRIRYPLAQLLAFEEANNITPINP